VVGVLVHQPVWQQPGGQQPQGQSVGAMAFTSFPPARWGR
jgi:hypothetical protein